MGEWENEKDWIGDQHRQLKEPIFYIGHRNERKTFHVGKMNWGDEST